MNTSPAEPSSSEEDPVAAAPRRRARWGFRVTCAAIVLCVFLIPIRVYLLRENWGNFPGLGTLANLTRAILSGTYDLGYVTLLMIVCLLIMLPLRRERWRGIAYALFLAAATASLAAALVNVQVVKTLGRPFNYPWFYYSGFLKSTEAKSAVMAGLTRGVIAALVSLCVGFALLALLVGRVADNITRNIPRQKRLAAASLFAALLCAYLTIGDRYLVKHAWPQEKLANPVYAFAQSILATRQAPQLFTMKTRYGDEEFLPPVARTGPTTRPAVRNIILFVFESLPAEYVDVYGSRFNVTPELAKWKPNAVTFTNIYAHAPATNKSLFSLLCSTYPWISYQTVSQEKPDIALPSLTSQLKAAGYASGFFYSADLGFQNSGEFVRHRGFDLVQDYHSRPNSRQLLTSEKWPFLNGSDDLSTVESMMQWLAQQPKDKPTFAMLWTMMTHYPYFTVGEDKDIGPKENLFNHYLNALKYGDAAFGVMMRTLEQRGLLDDTLVIVMGDHGEAFGRHFQLSHGNKIYEENCHIPLMLINRNLFHGETNATIGGIVDIAPTIAELLHQPPAETWQGRSLFDENRSGRTYFFAPWSDYWFGYRTGKTKVLYNASKDLFEVYDLSTDPREQHDLSAQRPADVAEGKQRLAAWVQYQNWLFERLMKN